MNVRAICVSVAVFFVTAAHSATAEDIELLHCYAGTYKYFSQGPLALLTWEQKGIVMSSHPRKLLDAAVVQCEGIQRGVGPTRKGDALCKIIDGDGDAIVASLPSYVGFDYDVKFLEGTGKWEGVQGTLRSTRDVRSVDGKNGIPDTYQGCRRERGQFTVAK